MYLGPIYALKADVSDICYHIALQPSDVPNMVLAFPADKEEEP